MSMDIEQNEIVFKDMIRRLRPDLYVLMDIIDTNRLNYFIVFKLLRHLINISNGTGWGKIEVLIRNNKVHLIEGIETDSVDEHISRVVKEDKVGGGRIKNNAVNHFSARELERLK